MYYCNSPSGNNDPIAYQTDCSDVAVLSYDKNDDIQIDSWLIEAYHQPSKKKHCYPINWLMYFCFIVHSMKILWRYQIISIIKYQMIILDHVELIHR